MPAMTLEIKGLNELIRNFSNAPKIVAEQMQRAMSKTVIDIRDEMQDKTPVDTGTLWRGYRFQSDILRGKVYNNVEYGAIVNIVHPSKSGFFERGALAAKPSIEKAWETALENVKKALAK
jgi:hypothetical protein